MFESFFWIAREKFLKITFFFNFLFIFKFLLYILLLNIKINIVIMVIKIFINYGNMFYGLINIDTILINMRMCYISETINNLNYTINLDRIVIN